MTTNDSAVSNHTYWAWWKVLFIYLCVVILGYILIPTIWGLTNGIVLGMQIGSDPAFHKEIAAVLTKEELNELESSFFSKIPMEKRPVVEAVVEKYLREVMWLPIHIVSNFIIFVILGLFLRLFRVHRQWFLLPICLLPATLTILNGPVIVKNWGLTVAAVVVVQVVTSFIIIKFGDWTSNRWRRSTQARGPEK